MIAPRMRMSRPTLGILIVAAAVLAAQAGAATVVKGKSGPLSATLAPSTHTPKVNAKWPITVTATLKGKPAHATAAYKFLVDGMQVAPTQYPSNNKHFSFTGHFTDQLVFPPASAGQGLTLDVVIKAAGHTVNLDWSIKSHM